MARLEVNLIGSFVYGINQGGIDLDSSAALVCEREGLDRELYYEESYADRTMSPRLRSLLRLGAGYLFRPGMRPVDMDSAQLLLKHALALGDSLKDGKGKLAALTLLGKYYFQKEDFKEAGSYFSTVVAACRAAGDGKGEAQALADRGINAVLEAPGKEEDLNRALALFRQQGNKIKEVELMTRIYEVYFYRGKLDTVQKMMMTVIQLEKAIGYRHIHYDYNVIAYICENTQDGESALYYSLQAIRVMEETGDLAFDFNFYFRVAGAYIWLDNFDEAFTWYMRSLPSSLGGSYRGGAVLTVQDWYMGFLGSLMCMSYGRHYAEALSFAARVTALYPPQTALDKMLLAQYQGRSYAGLKREGEAEKYFRMAIGLADSLISSPYTGKDAVGCYLDACFYYLDDRRQPDKARPLLAKLLRYPLENDYLHNQMRIAIVQYEIDSMEHKETEALHDMRRAWHLSDSIVSVRRVRHIEEMRTQYDLDRKEKSLALLNTETQLQRNQLEKAAIIRNVIIVGFIMTILLLALTFSRYRLRQRQQQVIAQKNEALQQLVKEKDELLAEKEWLLKEIHHRVKNNLQIVVSLLDTQSAYLDNESAIAAIRNSQHRMYAMALIHQKLYKSEGMDRINMRTYIRELVEYLDEDLASSRRINFELKVDDIELDAVHAVPVGLILNEAITNAIKYAFGDDDGLRERIVRIAMEYGEDGNLVLSIRDNGRGLPAGLHQGEMKSLGMELMKGLTGQLHGRWQLRSGNGVEIIIVFPQLLAFKAEISPFS